MHICAAMSRTPPNFLASAVEDQSLRVLDPVAGGPPPRLTVDSRTSSSVCGTATLRRLNPLSLDHAVQNSRRLEAHFFVREERIAVTGGSADPNDLAFQQAGHGHVFGNPQAEPNARRQVALANSRAG